jgi:glycosyltransferase involved in cell wall biosynthesis
MRNPSVSVIIATRDRPQLLRRTLEAVLSQDYDGMVDVVLVFDQCPTDPSLASAVEGRVVRVVTNERSHGLAGARNSGALASTGDILAFCDDDDVWLPGKVTRQVAVLQNSGADTVASGILIDFEGQLTERVPTAEYLTVEALLRRRVFEAHPSTVLVRRAAFFDQIGPVDEDIPGGYGEDYDWMIRAAEHGPIALVPEPLVTVLWHRASFFAGRWETIILALDYLLAKHPRFADQPSGLARIYGQKAFAYAGLGRRAEARRWALRALRLAVTEKRAYLALLISVRLLHADVALRLAHAGGRGI